MPKKNEQNIFHQLFLISLDNVWSPNKNGRTNGQYQTGDAQNGWMRPVKRPRYLILGLSQHIYMAALSKHIFMVSEVRNIFSL